MSDWRSELSTEERERIERRSHPDRMAPMLATLTDERFSDDDWLFERKLDGERILAFRDGDSVRLMTRNDKRADETYPEIVDALARQPVADFVLDGEVVAFEDGVSSFSRLQQRMKIRDAEKARDSDVAVHYYVFDLPHLDGCSLDALPLRTRKRLLRKLFEFSKPLHFTPHRNGDGEAYFEQACEKGWEGIIAKRAASEYGHSRSRDWLKFKCENGQELVIAGFTEPQGKRKGFGALIVGYHDRRSGDLRYAGRVGTGFDDEFLESFRARLDAIETDDCPFDHAPDDDAAHWVKPRYVGEFGFTEWTRDGRLRHPRFLGLRRDKQPGDVVRETPE